MMDVFYGHRRYGRVRGYGGEYLETEFVYICYIPVFPASSFWVTNEPGNAGSTGFPIRLHWRSVIATYLRVWMPALAACVFLYPSMVATSISLGLLGLSAWSWTWWSRRGTGVRQRSDFDRVALGSRCDPAWMTDDMREHLARTLTARLAEREDSRPPEDVARSGARDLDEAAIAYGLLRLTGVRRADARRAADQLLASVFDERTQAGEPYRDGAHAVRGLGEQIAATARSHAIVSEARGRAMTRHWIHDRSFQLGMAACLTGLCGYLVWLRLGHTSVDVRALDAVPPPAGERIVVRCDRADPSGWQIGDRRDSNKHLILCWVGKRLLAVTASDMVASAGTFSGALVELPPAGAAAPPWVAQLRSDPRLDASTFEVYLHSEDEVDHRAKLLGILMTGAGALASWCLWLRSFRRRSSDGHAE